MRILRDMAAGAGVGKRGLDGGHLAVLEVLAESPMGFDEAERVAQDLGTPNAQLPIGVRVGLAFRGAVRIAGYEQGKVTRELTSVGAAVVQAAKN